MHGLGTPEDLDNFKELLIKIFLKDETFALYA